MKSFCLITPPSIFLLDERVFVSLGILKVAAVLESIGAHVEVLDLSGVSNYIEAVRAHAEESTAEVYGVTATTPQMPAAHEILKALRMSGTKKHVVLGGPHATLVHAAARREITHSHPGRVRATRAMTQLCVDWDQVVAGDGERAIVLIAEGNTDKVIDADDPKGELFLKRGELDELPMPARHLVDLDSYHYQIDGVRATSLIAQLGCPYKCNFCAGRYSPMLRRIRTRSVESIVSEIRLIYETYGHTGFMCYDDEINVSKDMVKLMRELAKLQSKLKVSFQLRGFIKAELFNEEQANAMYEAGFRWLLTGFESGAPRILENIEKNATLEENTRCFELARAAGLKVKALMSIGHAGESEETCRQTEAWLLKMKPDDFDVTIITTYPGSPYYDDAIQTAPGIYTFTAPKSQDRLHAIELDYNTTADYYKGKPDGGYQAYVYTDHMSSQDLVTIRDQIERNVREKLGLPWNQGAPAIQFEHSMGQSGPLPPNILRTSEPKPVPTQTSKPEPRLRLPLAR